MATATRRRSRPADGACPAVFLLPEELKLLDTWHPNVLISGPREAATALIAGLTAGLRQPVLAWQTGAALPSAGIGTLVLHGVAGLTEAEQRRLHEWLVDNGPDVQVIATTVQPLFPLVLSGRFDATLYYELNVIFLELAGALSGR